jgi:PAS domain S-box-containing protein
MTKFRKLTTAVVWALICLFGLAVGRYGEQALRQRLRAEVISQAVVSAAAFSPDDLRGLSGTGGEVSAAAHRTVKERLFRLQVINPQARLLFLLRVAPATGKGEFLADSQPPGPGMGFLPGEDISSVFRSEALLGVIRTGQPAIEGPNSDPAGPLVLAYAPVSGASFGQNVGQTDEILGLEIVASDWVRRSWLRALECAVAAWLALGLPFQALLMNSRQREQRRALRNLLTAIEQSHSAVMIVNLESRIEYVNAGLCEQIGYARRELIGRLWRDFQQPETRPELLAEMVANVRSGRAWTGEWFNRRKNEELYSVRGTITPVRNRQGKMAGFVSVFEDMTEIRRNETILRAALDRAESGDRTKSRFLATMSHEVRTPLNGIVGFTGLLLETTLSAEQAEYVQTIRTSGEALIQLTSDILDFARIESGSMKLELQPANPRACVEDTLDLLAVLAASKNIELLHWVDDDVPAVIMADDSRVRQVLVNLVNNAVKFTEKGLVEVTVRAKRTESLEAPDSPAWTIKFAVRDTGIGIASEYGERLFKPFRQVDESTTRRHGGSGLGLAISKNLVELMGGEIHFHSAIGSGSVFEFTLPAAEVAGLGRAPASLGRLRVALVAQAGPFRDEFVHLAARWGVTFLEFDSTAGLGAGAGDWDIAFVELDDERAALFAGQPPPTWHAERTYALVPVSLPSELRVALRGNFCQLINKPLHHDAMASLMAGFRPAATGKEPGKAYGLSVLVVEDNLVNQRLVQKLLQNLGCTAVVAANGRIALEKLQSAPAPYDLVLMDLHMPELDGLGAIEKIRAGEAGPVAKALWITVLTADARAAQKEKVLAAGANDYLVKPVSLSELAQGLQRFLSQR